MSAHWVDTVLASTFALQSAVMHAKEFCELVLRELLIPRFNLPHLFCKRPEVPSPNISLQTFRENWQPCNWNMGIPINVLVLVSTATAITVHLAMIRFNSCT